MGGATCLRLTLLTRLDAGDLGVDGRDPRLRLRKLDARRLGVGLGLGDLRLLGALERFELGAVLHLHLPDGSADGDGQLDVDARELAFRRTVRALGRTALAFSLVHATRFELGLERFLVGVARGNRGRRLGGRFLGDRRAADECQQNEEHAHGYLRGAR